MLDSLNSARGYESVSRGLRASSSKMGESLRTFSLLLVAACSTPPASTSDDMVMNHQKEQCTNGTPGRFISASGSTIQPPDVKIESLSIMKDKVISEVFTPVPDGCISGKDSSSRLPGRLADHKPIQNDWVRIKYEDGSEGIYHFSTTSEEVKPSAKPTPPTKTKAVNHQDCSQYREKEGGNWEYLTADYKICRGAGCDPNKGRHFKGLFGKPSLRALFCEIQNAGFADCTKWTGKEILVNKAECNFDGSILWSM